MLVMANPSITAGNFILTESLPHANVPVEVRVHFGPANKSAIEKKVFVKEGATPKEALATLLPVEEGAICCHPGEVKGIDGVSSDPLRNRWWRLKINGSAKGASPHKTHLRAGDLVEWFYFEDLQ